MVAYGQSGFSTKILGGLMPLPAERPCPPRNQDAGKVFLISMHKTEYEEGAKVIYETPRYDLGAFTSSLDAERICNRMNQRLWKLKELEFLTTIGGEADDCEDVETGLEYTDKARDTDRKMEHFRVVSVDLKSYSEVASSLPVEVARAELLAS